MFTGIVEEQGTVLSLTRRQEGAHLTIQGGADMTDLAVGESVAVDGVCLTVVQRNAATFTTDLSVETLQRTTLGDLKPQVRVNLERALKVGDRLGGHFVTGHVDGVGRIIRLESAGDSKWMWIRFPAPLAPYIAPKGSIALDGVSLTLVEATQQDFSVCLIPHTLAMTTLGWKGRGSLVNLEVDLLSRYLERLLGEHTVQGRYPFTRELLHEQGFA
jgi:riboflavin synthase